MGVKIINVFWVVFSKNLIPSWNRGFGIIQDHIVDSSPFLRVVMTACPLPYYFILKIFNSKDAIHNDLQIMAGGGVAMQVDAAGWFEHAAQLNEADGHHGKIGEHVGVAQHLAHGNERLADLLSAFGHFPVCSRGGMVPMPGVLKRLELRGGLGSVVLFEEHVVGGFAVEGRVEVDQVNGLVGHVAAEDVEVVTVIECVHCYFLDMQAGQVQVLV